MSAQKLTILPICVLVAMGASAAWARQLQNTPHLGYVYPAGGQQGTTVQVKVGGRFLDGADRTNAVLVSGRGVRATVAAYDRPIPAPQLTVMRDRLQELQKKGPDPATRTEMLDLRMKIGDTVRRNANPVLSEFVMLEVAIDRDAEPGPRQLRLGTTLGLTNPLAFVVGQLPEFREKDDKLGKADAELSITLPATVNGRMIPGDVDRLQAPMRQPQQYAPGDADRYRFTARTGQDLVVAVSARDLMPYLADAVPGWFQAVVTLFDASGRELACADDYRFQPDPLLHYRIPADGDYVIEIRDALFRGREDFVYRVSVGELPFITSVFPLGGPARSKTVVEVAGWNLAAKTLTMDARDAGPGIYPLSMRRGVTVSNRVPFELDTLPEVAEREPNGAVREAQRVKLPVIVNGRIQEAGDADTFGFEGRAGDQVVAEVSARRLASPLDSVIELTDAAGRRVAVNDDYDDKGAGLVTHQADSMLMATLPANGTYYLRVGDVQHRGGTDYVYRLRLSAPRPDFDLRIAPSAINASAGASVPVTVHALRKDGFSGDIVLSLKDAPGGFMLSGGVVPAGQDRVRFTLTVPPRAASESDGLFVEGRAVVAGKPVVRRAVPADDMMQAFLYRHLVTAEDLRVFVIARGATRVPVSIVSAQPVKIPAGSGAQVRVTVPPGYRTFEKIEFELSEPPDGISLSGLSLGFAGADFVLQADAAKIKPGVRGTLIVTVSGERVPPANATGGAARRRLPIGILPAIPFEIVAPR